MPEIVSIDNLQSFKRGSYLKRPVVNALIEVARAKGLPPGRGDFNDGSGPVRRRQGHTRDALSWLRCESDDAARPFSIVEVYDARLDRDGVVLIVREVVTFELGMILAGNEDYDLYASSDGWVKLINPYEPVIVNVDDASIPIVFGDFLSVTSINVTYDSSNTGLLALTSESGTGTDVSGTGSDAGSGPGNIPRVAVLGLSGSGSTVAMGRATTGISAASNSLTGATTFSWKRFVNLDAGVTPHTQQEEAEATAGVNRAPLISAGIDSVVIMSFTEGEWLLIGLQEACPT